MDNAKTKRAVARAKRMKRVRKTIHGTAVRPRLSVSKTNAHLYAQLIDDDKKVTIAGVGTLSKGIKARKSKETAQAIGKQIAELAKSSGIKSVLFDRGRYKYHGIIAELATSARDAGLQF